MHPSLECGLLQQDGRSPRTDLAVADSHAVQAQNTIAHTRHDGDGIFPTDAQISVLHQQASSVTIPVIYVCQIKMSIHIASECWVSDLKRLRKFGELRCREEKTHSG
jgi:hypothetical protein